MHSTTRDVTGVREHDSARVAVPAGTPLSSIYELGHIIDGGPSFRAIAHHPTHGRVKVALLSGDITTLKT